MRQQNAVDKINILKTLKKEFILLIACRNVDFYFFHNVFNRNKVNILTHLQ